MIVSSLDIHTLGWRLAVLVVSPACDAPIASQRDRVTSTSSDRNEVAVGRRHQAVAVPFPARDTSVASHRKRVIIMGEYVNKPPHGNHFG